MRSSLTSSKTSRNTPVLSTVVSPVSQADPPVCHAAYTEDALHPKMLALFCFATFSRSISLESGTTAITQYKDVPAMSCPSGTGSTPYSALHPPTFSPFQPLGKGIASFIHVDTDMVWTQPTNS